MNKIILSSILIGISFVLIGAFYSTMEKTDSEEVTLESIQEEVNTAILSTKLSSYGWKTQEDYNSGLFALNGYVNSKINEAKELEKYQGPVPEGYDQEHFYKTGELIKK